MRYLRALVLALILLAPAAAGAEVIFESEDGKIVLRRSGGKALPEARAAAVRRAATRPSLTALIGAGKRDQPRETLILPSYFVDPATADTTLFAVRNAGGGFAALTIRYFGSELDDLQYAPDPLLLLPREVVTVNLRDVIGELTPRPDGTYRGLVTFLTDELITGDYFRTDPANAFASGDRLVGLDDFCRRNEVRFIAGGPFTGGTLLTFLIDQPQGISPGDLPTAFIRSFDEAGNPGPEIDFFTTENSATFPVSLIGLSGFGVIEIDFDQTTGVVIAEYSALGQFSVAMNGTCTDPE